MWIVVGCLVALLVLMVFVAFCVYRNAQARSMLTSVATAAGFSKKADMVQGLTTAVRYTQGDNSTGPLMTFGSGKDFRDPPDETGVMSYSRMKQHEAKGKGSHVFVTDGADGMISVKMTADTFEGLKSGKVKMKKLMES